MQHVTVVEVATKPYTIETKIVSLMVNINITSIREFFKKRKITNDSLSISLPVCRPDKSLLPSELANAEEGDV